MEWRAIWSWLGFEARARRLRARQFRFALEIKMLSRAHYDSVIDANAISLLFDYAFLVFFAGFASPALTAPRAKTKLNSDDAAASNFQHPSVPRKVFRSSGEATRASTQCRTMAPRACLAYTAGPGNVIVYTSTPRFVNASRLTDFQYSCDAQFTTNGLALDSPLVAACSSKSSAMASAMSSPQYAYKSLPDGAHFVPISSRYGAMASYGRRQPYNPLKILKCFCKYAFSSSVFNVDAFKCLNAGPSNAKAHAFVAAFSKFPNRSTLSFAMASDTPMSVFRSPALSSRASRAIAFARSANLGRVARVASLAFIAASSNALAGLRTTTNGVALALALALASSRVVVAFIVRLRRARRVDVVVEVVVVEVVVEVVPVLVLVAHRRAHARMTDDRTVESRRRRRGAASSRVRYSDGVTDDW